jgi:hypothetical protein
VLECVEISLFLIPTLTQLSLSKAAYQMWRGAPCESIEKHGSQEKTLTLSHRPARIVSNPSENARATSNLWSSDILRGNTNPSSTPVTPTISFLRMVALLQAPYRSWLPLMEAPTTALIMRGRSHFQKAIQSDGHMITQDTQTRWIQAITT